MRSISVINTGIQLVNVIEAVNQNGCEENYLVIGQFNLHPDRIRQIRKMLQDEFLNSHFKKIYGLPKQFSPKNPLRFVSYILTYIKFAWIILRAKKFDFCFFGVYTDIIMRPIAFLSWYRNRKINICLIDEGVRVMTDAANRVQQRPMIEKQLQRRVFFLREFFLAVTRRWFPPALTYFTVYQLPLKGNDSIVFNEYAFFKNNNPYRYSFSPDSVVIIGQPYVELKIIAKQSYAAMLNKILEENTGKNLHYLPHPLETLYSSLLPSDVRIIQSQYPVEMLLLGSDVITIAGFNSSALYNAAKMKLCRQIISYAFRPEHYIAEQNTEANDRLIRTFREAGIEIRCE